MQPLKGERYFYRDSDKNKGLIEIVNDFIINGTVKILSDFTIYRYRKNMISSEWSTDIGNWKLLLGQEKEEE